MASPVSIVTPFHNTAAYLDECIRSVLSQTHTQYEYILVDNCSTDGSYEIAERYARSHRNIRLLRTGTLLSQVDNYNFALSQISPESRYCKIVQADDWLYPQCIAAMVAIAEQDSGIGLVASYVLRGKSVNPSGLGYDTRVMTGRDTCRAYFLDDIYLFGSPTAHMFRSDLVRARIRFYDPSLKPFEDADVCFDLLRSCKFAFLHQVLSYSRDQEDSMLHQLRNHGWREAVQFCILLRWGHEYLSGSEYGAVFARRRKHYLSVLADGFAKRADRSYWEFHKQLVAGAGAQIRARDLVVPVIYWYLDRIGNPLRTIRNLLHAESRLPNGRK